MADDEGVGADDGTRSPMPSSSTTSNKECTRLLRLCCIFVLCVVCAAKRVCGVHL